MWPCVLADSSHGSPSAWSLREVGSRCACLFGRNLGDDVFTILIVLVVGRGVSNLIWPYVVGVLASGEHRRVRLTPVVEGFCNLAVSVWLLTQVGAIGAAIGSLVASVLAVVMHLAINVPRTPAVRFDRRSWFAKAVVRSSSVALPLLTVPLIAFVPTQLARWPLTLIVVVASGVLAARELAMIRRLANDIARVSPAA
jgi:predicted membrane-bound spermidine synthase